MAGLSSAAAMRRRLDGRRATPPHLYVSSCIEPCLMRVVCEEASEMEHLPFLPDVYNLTPQLLSHPSIQLCKAPLAPTREVSSRPGYYSHGMRRNHHNQTTINQIMHQISSNNRATYYFYFSDNTTLFLTSLHWCWTC